MEIVMPVKKTFTINEQNDAFIERALDQGEFSNASEMVRAGLRMLETEQLKLAELRHEIDKGIKSYNEGRYTVYASAKDLHKDIIGE